jgi:HEAT repeat protein
MTDIQIQLTALKSENPAERAQAAQTLGLAKAAQAVDTLINLLADPVVGVRREAVYALRRIRDERASIPMIQMLNDPDDAIRRSASTWFMTLTGDQTYLVEPLCEIMLAEDSRMSARDFAAMLLGKFGDDRAVEPLHRLIHKYPRMRLRAILSLLRMSDPRSMPVLSELLMNDDLRVQQTAVKVLKSIGTPEALNAVQQWEQNQDR